jgi:hypothetical protein
MPTHAVFIDSNGGHSATMDQAAMFKHLKEHTFVPAGYYGSLSSALNHVFDGRGKATPEYEFGVHKNIRHATGGTTDKDSVTLFYYEAGTVAYIFAVGRHIGRSEYRLTYAWQQGDDVWGKDKRILI